MAADLTFRYGTVTDFYPGMPAPEGDDDPFVIAGVLHRSTTLVYGQTKAGKSTLAASMAIAVAGQAPTWLGREVTRHGHALIVAGDPDGEREYGRRLRAGGAGNVRLYAPTRPAIPETWAEVAMIARSQQSAMVVIDNLSAFVPGTLNDDLAVKRFYDQTDQLARDGAAVLIVAHTSEKAGEHGPSRVPMGSSFIRFGPRWWCYAHRARGKLLLDFDGNDGRPWGLAVSEPDGTPSFDLLGETTADELAERRERKSRERATMTREHRERIAQFVLAECQGASRNATGERVAERFGGAAGTHKNQLSRGAYGVRQVGASGRWERGTAQGGTGTLAPQ